MVLTIAGRNTLRPYVFYYIGMVATVERLRLTREGAGTLAVKIVT